MPESALYLLLLEDSDDDAALIERHLQQHLPGTRVIRAPHYQEYERILGNGMGSSFDLVLADYRLWEYSAVDALRFLRSRGLDTPFIVVTGVIPEEQVVQLLHEGASDYLLKSSLWRLESAITNAIERARLKRDQRETAHLYEDFRQALLAQLDPLEGLTSNLAMYTTAFRDQLDKVRRLIAEEEEAPPKDTP